jgi:two-component system, NtrC family, response regulator AtoC
VWRILGVVERGHLRSQISRSLAAPNRNISFAKNLDEATTRLSTETYHAVIADDQVVGESLSSLLKALGSEPEGSPALVILTDFRRGHARFDLGGFLRWTLLKKPINPNVLQTTIQAFLDQVRLKYAVNYLRHKEKYIYSFRNIIGASRSMKSVLDLIEKVAASQSAVLINGERGTGKETIAGAIHFNSGRRHENFVVVNCSALSESELEHELFGRAKGVGESSPSFRIGRVEQANTGTLYLNGIQALSLPLQAKVLRLFQLGEFERIGGVKTVKVDVRILCGTRANLRDLVEKGLFREDLYFRINVIPVHMPPLRDRKEDIPALAQFFLHKYRRENGLHEVSFSPKAIEPLMEYQWPGNIRELENVVERALIVCDKQEIQPEDILLEPSSGSAEPSQRLLSGENLDLEELERSAVIEALTRANGVQKVAGKILGISPRVMHYKIRKHKLAE